MILIELINILIELINILIELINILIELINMDACIASRMHHHSTVIS